MNYITSRIRKPGFLVENWFRNKNLINFIQVYLHNIESNQNSITKPVGIENIFFKEHKIFIDELGYRISIEKNSRGIPFLRKMPHLPN